MQKSILQATFFPESKIPKMNWRRDHLKVPSMSLFGDHEDVFVCPRHSEQPKFQPTRAYDTHIEVGLFHDICVMS